MKCWIFLQSKISSCLYSATLWYFWTSINSRSKCSEASNFFTNIGFVEFFLVRLFKRLRILVSGFEIYRRKWTKRSILEMFFMLQETSFLNQKVIVYKNLKTESCTSIIKHEWTWRWSSKWGNSGLILSQISGKKIEGPEYSYNNWLT